MKNVVCGPTPPCLLLAPTSFLLFACLPALGIAFRVSPPPPPPLPLPGRVAPSFKSSTAHAGAADGVPCSLPHHPSSSRRVRGQPNLPPAAPKGRQLPPLRPWKQPATNHGRLVGTRTLACAPAAAHTPFAPLLVPPTFPCMPPRLLALAAGPGAAFLKHLFISRPTSAWSLPAPPAGRRPTSRPITSPSPPATSGPRPSIRQTRPCGSATTPRRHPACGGSATRACECGGGGWGCVQAAIAEVGRAGQSME